MRAILEFDLPEEKEEFDLAKDGYLYSIVCEDFDNELRRILKYDSDTSDFTDQVNLQKIRAGLEVAREIFNNIRKQVLEK